MPMNNKSTDTFWVKDIHSITLEQLTSLLTKDVDYRANFELAQRIVHNNTNAVNYYIGVLSLPIISHIEKTIIHRDILTEFYEFISNPFNEKNACPEWHKVALYKGETCRLDSYTSLIATRHFCKISEKEQERRKSECDLIEYKDYQSLLHCTNDDDVHEYTVGSKLWKARETYKMLCERDQLVILYLVIEKKSALEAWPLLEPYIKPRAIGNLTSEEVKSSWTNKQKQDGLSLIKGRAIKNYMNIFNTL